MNVDSINEQELAIIALGKQKIQEVETQKRIAELELQIEVLKIFVKYGLSEGDIINDATGKIVRLSQQPVV